MSKSFQTFHWAIKSSATSSVTLGGMEKFVILERLGLGLFRTLFPLKKKKKKGKMLVNLIDRMWLKFLDIVLSSYSWHSHNCFFFHVSSWVVVCLVLFLIFSQVSLSLSPSHKILSHHRYFSPTITHRIVWMRQQLLYILLPQTKLHLQFLSSIPKEKPYLNISDMQWPHILTFLLVFCNSFVVLPAPEWCFNSESHVPTFFE